MNAIFLLGLPCSGKTTYANTLGIDVINTDFHLEFLAEKHHVNLSNLEQQKKLYDKYKREISVVTFQKLNKKISLKEDIIIDSTSCNSSFFIARYNYLSSFGYNILIHFLNTNIDDCLYNNRHRYRKVDVSYIENCYNNLQQNFDMYKQYIKTII